MRQFFSNRQVRKNNPVCCCCSHHDKHDEGCCCKHTHTISEKSVHSQSQGNGHQEYSCSCAACASMQDDPEVRRALPRLLLFRLLLAAILLISGLILSAYSTLSFGLSVLAWLTAGIDVFFKIGKNLMKGRVFDEAFLMGVATIGALFLGEAAEAAGVMLFYQIGELLESLAVHRSRTGIASLFKLRPDTAWVLDADASPVPTPIEQVPVGARILVRPGEIVPLDGIILNGRSSVETAALTGESLPRDVSPNSTVLAGFLNGSGSLILSVTAPANDTVAARVVRLTQEAARQASPAESLVTRFARIYTPVVLLLAAAIALLPPLFLPGAEWQVFLSRGLTFLVISCPCALVVSIPLAYFSGIGGAAQKGILLRNSAVLDRLVRIKTAVFDKTGTLTSGHLKVDQILPAPGVSKQQLLRLAATAEKNASHPLAKAVLECCSHPIANASIRERPGLGIEAVIGKCTLYAGNRSLMEQQQISLPKALPNGTAIYLALDQRYLGMITVTDTLRQEAASSIHFLRMQGVQRITVLTGDTFASAQDQLDFLHVDSIAAELLPDQKLAELERELACSNGALLYVGDGINDAPSLQRADVGIAMGGAGSDAAVASADAVLMTDDLTRIPLAIDIARKTRRIVLFNTLFALGIKLMVLFLSAFGQIPMWLAALSDVGVALLCILNAVRAFRSPTHFQNTDTNTVDHSSVAHIFEF